MNCPKCKGDMDDGFIPDMGLKTYIQSWAKGDKLSRF